MQARHLNRKPPLGVFPKLSRVSGYDSRQLLHWRMSILVKHLVVCEQIFTIWPAVGKSASQSKEDTRFATNVAPGRLRQSSHGIVACKRSISKTNIRMTATWRRSHAHGGCSAGRTQSEAATSSLHSTSTTNRLRLPLAPVLIPTPAFAHPNRFATSPISSSFAFPSTGGDLSRAVKVPSPLSTNSLTRALGFTSTSMTRVATVEKVRLRSADCAPAAGWPRSTSRCRA